MTTASTTSPKFRICPHCGKVLQARYTDALAEVTGIRMFCGYEECDCAGAEADRRDAEERAARKAAEDRAEALRRRYLRTGVPERYLSLDHVKAGALADKMGRGKWLYLWGDVGTRKTTCAAAIAKRLADSGSQVLMVPMYRILDEIQCSFHDGGDPLKRYCEARYLIVDDLGKRRPTGFVLDSLFQLVDRRYSAMLPTCVTTQYRPGELVRRLAEQGDPDTAKAIVSRLRHGAEVVEFTGPDGRLS